MQATYCCQAASWVLVFEDPFDPMTCGNLTAQTQSAADDPRSPERTGWLPKTLPRGPSHPKKTRRAGYIICAEVCWHDSSVASATSGVYTPFWETSPISFDCSRRMKAVKSHGIWLFRQSNGTLIAASSSQAWLPVAPVPSNDLGSSSPHDALLRRFWLVAAVCCVSGVTSCQSWDELRATDDRFGLCHRGND